MRRRLATTALVAAAAWPPPAAAQQATPRCSCPTPCDTQLQLKVERVGGPRSTTLVGSRVRVRGRTDDFVAGQSVVVRFYLAGKKHFVRRMALRPGPGGSGLFALSYRPGRPGTLVVRASHRATPRARRRCAARAQARSTSSRAASRPARRALGGPRAAAPAAPAGLRHRPRPASSTAARRGPCSPSARSPAWRARPRPRST